MSLQVRSVWTMWRTTRTCTPAQRPSMWSCSPSRLKACSWLQPTGTDSPGPSPVLCVCLHGNPHVSSRRDSRPGSGIYKWRNGSFHLYQNISTQEARAWKHFSIDEQVRAEIEVSIYFWPFSGSADK